MPSVQIQCAELMTPLHVSRFVMSMQESIYQIPCHVTSRHVDDAIPIQCMCFTALYSSVTPVIVILQHSGQCVHLSVTTASRSMFGTNDPSGR